MKRVTEAEKLSVCQILHSYKTLSVNFNFLIEILKSMGFKMPHRYSQMHFDIKLVVLNYFLLSDNPFVDRLRNVHLFIVQQLSLKHLCAMITCLFPKSRLFFVLFSFISYKYRHLLLPCYDPPCRQALRDCFSRDLFQSAN